MKQRPYNPPEPRVIALAATKPRVDANLWLLCGAYVASVVLLCNLFVH